MAHELLIAFGLIATGSQPLPQEGAPTNIAPPGGPATRYCLRVEPIIGSRIETIMCRTREQWAMLEIDVDQEWAENGVRIRA